MKYTNLINDALEKLRHARNNMSREDFFQSILDACEDGNLRYPLHLAGMAASQSHIEALKATKNPSDEARVSICPVWNLLD